MKTNLFYTTHLIMIVCVAGIVSAGWPEYIHSSVKRMQDLPSCLQLLKKLKAAYLITKESKDIKIMLVNILTIGMQISNQLFK